MIKLYRADRVMIVAIFLLVFVIALYTPMQSDDYSFYLTGLSFSAHLKFYMTWSGRVIADYLSTSILAFNQHLVIAFISSLAVPLLIYQIATIPCDHTKHERPSALTMALLFMTYWLANPALGQTTFWVVGQCNYLWPLVFVSTYIKYLLKYLHQTVILKKHYTLLLCLAFLAGCSNEATGALVVYVTVAIFLFALYHKLPNKICVVISLIVVLLGFAVLIGAPGNFVRAQHPEFMQWRAIAFMTRLSNHVFHTMPTIFKSYGVAYFVLLWGLYQAKGYLNKAQWQLIAIHMIGCVIFVSILIASPGAVQSRTHLTGLFFLLIATSFVLKTAFQTGQIVSLLGRILFIGLLGYFLLSYVVVFFAYYGLTQQSAIRIAILQAQKAKGIKHIVIPAYVAPFVLKNTDLPEISHHSSGGMATYYGVGSVERVFVDFDYTRIVNTPCLIKPVQTDGMIACVYKQSPLLTGMTTVIVQLAPNIGVPEYRASSLRLKIFNGYEANDERYYTISIPVRAVKVGDSYFANAHVVTNLIYPDKQAKASVVLQRYEEGQLKEASPSVSINP